MHRARFAFAAALAAALSIPVLLGCQTTDAPAAPLVFGDAFWKHWGDGRAELAGYDLTFKRYGTLRRGVAVAIFVTETFSNDLRVKADPGKHSKSDEYPVVKLNLVRDFPTGIYDYNLMTSAFVALTDVNGRPPGSPTKVSFSSQEWCGNVYAQLLFDRSAVRHTLHSYFDGEADREGTFPVPNTALSEDALLLWARGMAAPALAPGESREAPIVRSLAVARLRHQDVVVSRAKLSRAAAPHEVTVPAGTIRTEAFTVAIPGEQTWVIDVEEAAPHRIVRWETDDGEKGELLSSARLKYWEMNGEGFESALSQLGLKPRPLRMP